MEIKACLNILVRRIWVVILIPVMAAGLTAAISVYALEPVYESSVTLYVMHKDADTRLAYDDFLASQQLINDCRELVKSKSVSKAVIEQLNLVDLNSEDLAKKIKVNLKNDTRLLEIKVRDTNNQRALEIADKISSIIQKKVNDLMNLDILDVVDEAEISNKPVSPRPFFNTFIVFLASLFLTVSSVFVIEYLDDTLKNSEDIEKHLGIKVIGIIPSLDLK